MVQEHGGGRLAPESDAAREGDKAAEHGARSEVEERRAHRRARVLWGATLRCADGDTVLSCTVANISAGGAKLVFSCTPDDAETGVIARLVPGATVVLAFRQLGRLAGEVVWREDGRLGMRFSLSPEDVAARIGQVVDLDPM